MPDNKTSSDHVRYVVQLDDDLNVEKKSPMFTIRRVLMLISLLMASGVGIYFLLQTFVFEGADEVFVLEALDAEATEIDDDADFVMMETELTGLEETAAQKGWTKLGRADPTTPLQMVIVLKLTNVDQLEERLIAVSTPGDPLYGHHLSLSEVNKLTRPNPTAIAAILAWMGADEGDYIEGGFIRRVVTVEEAETLLMGDYHLFEHSSGAQAVRMMPNYSVPAVLAPYISFITPTLRFPARSVMQDRSWKYTEVTPDMDLESTPFKLRDMYNVVTTGSVATNKQAVAEFLTQIFSQDDQDAFYEQYYPPGTGTIITIAGGSTTQPDSMPGIETMLDTEYITVMGTGIDTEDWSFMYDPSLTSPQTCAFLDWMIKLGETDDDVIPHVFSVSYGEDEADLGSVYATRLDEEFMKAGVRGISIMFASGDEGANCEGSEFAPEFPASSPHVTAVGGTAGDEDVSAWHYSSGGFSNYFDRPSWQEEVVSDYLELSETAETAAAYGVNTNGRAYPDVSAKSVGYPVTCGGVDWMVSGTSCSSPVFAGMVALLNDQLLAQNRPTLGFLNPLLYSTDAKEAFVDVTSGYSYGCNDGTGWLASTGWDATTGVGYPDYGTLSEIIG